MASNYEQLVKALRCGEFKPECGSSDCPYWSGLGCMDGQLMEDAAAAIEELQAEVKDALNEGYNAGYTAGIGYCSFKKTKQPKRGEWIGVNPMVDSVQCSVCGGQLFSEELETPYCPYCGAKMEVHEVGNIH